MNYPDDLSTRSNKEIDEVYKAHFPSKDPRTIVNRLAREAAQEYKNRGETIPDHVKAALAATDM